MTQKATTKIDPQVREEELDLVELFRAMFKTELESK